MEKDDKLSYDEYRKQYQLEHPDTKPKKEEKDIITLIQNSSIPDDILKLVISQLRDRPYLLMSIRQNLMKKDFDKSRREYLDEIIFDPLWIISFKYTFVQQIIALYENSYFMKRDYETGVFNALHKNVFSGRYEEGFFLYLGYNNITLLEQFYTKNKNPDIEEAYKDIIYHDNVSIEDFLSYLRKIIKTQTDEDNLKKLLAYRNLTDRKSTRLN